MTARAPAVDCDPAWSTDWQPSDRTPTRFDLRQAEIRDMRDQGPGPKALWTAQDVPASHYL